jgi:BirA family biotin operon repressor/biotin-[acetyl-CoA-carboxylase] ligase
MDALEAQAIAARLGRAEVAVEVTGRCDSTNARLLARAFAENRAVLLAAEEQTAGRGRRGRRWRSARGDGATFSILRRMRCAPSALAGLSLAMGVAVARALRSLGARTTALKWPNDLLVGDAKLGGILVETRQQGSETAAVIGIGINCRAAPALAVRLRRRIAALDSVLRPPVARNALIGTVAREVLGALEAFERSGLAAFVEDWRRLHALEGRRLRVRLADGRSLTGVASGLARDGALRLRTRAGLRAISGGRILAARAA